LGVQTAMNNDKRKLVANAAIIVLIVFGVSTSVMTGEKLRATANANWLSSGKVDARRMTGSILFWISKAEVNLRAIAGQFRSGNYSTQQSFFKFIDDAESWDPDVTFGSAMYAKRVLRKDRDAYEKEHGANLTVINKPNQRAPEQFESYAVQLLSRKDGVFQKHTDLTTIAAIRTAVITARQTLGHVILGSAFKGKDGKPHAAIATATDLDNGSGIMAATINLEDFFSEFTADYLPNGIQVRLIERDSETRATNVFIPIIGTLDPAPEVVATEVIRITSGQARWDLHWDIMPDYQGGPSDEFAILVSVGGSTLTLMVALIVYFLAMQNFRFQTLVRDRTAELSQNSMLVQLTMDSIDQGFAVWNADHRLVLWSKRCADFWYYPKNLRPGTHLEELLKHLAKNGAFGKGKIEEITQRELKRVIESGGGSEEKFSMKDGRRLHLRRFPLERGGHVSMYTDVTERELATEELKNSHDALERRVEERTRDLERARDAAVTADRTKSVFMANMSHELRTPLNAIIGFSQLAANEIHGPLGNSKYLENASIVATAGEHLLQLISDILDLSKIEANAMTLDEENVDMVAAANTIKSIIQPRAEHSDIDLNVSIADSLPNLYGDSLRIKQMMLNLADNAVKYTSNGGKVVIKIDTDKSKSVRIIVSDTGVGISKDDLQLVLVPFGQVNSNSMVRQGDGIGLGLALVKQLVELHGGTLMLESELGVGTTATLVFPSERSVGV
jgi:signal transduction histidine kinase